MTRSGYSFLSYLRLPYNLTLIGFSAAFTGLGIYDLSTTADSPILMTLPLGLWALVLGSRYYHWRKLPADAIAMTFADVIKTLDLGTAKESPNVSVSLDITDDTIKVYVPSDVDVRVDTENENPMDEGEVMALVKEHDAEVTLEEIEAYRLAVEALYVDLHMPEDRMKTFLYFNDQPILLTAQTNPEDNGMYLPSNWQTRGPIQRFRCNMALESLYGYYRASGLDVEMDLLKANREASEDVIDLHYIGGETGDAAVEARLNALLDNENFRRNAELVGHFGLKTDFSLMTGEFSNASIIGAARQTGKTEMAHEFISDLVAKADLKGLALAYVDYMVKGDYAAADAIMDRSAQIGSVVTLRNYIAEALGLDYAELEEQLKEEISFASGMDIAAEEISSIMQEDVEKYATKGTTTAVFLDGMVSKEDVQSLAGMMGMQVSEEAGCSILKPVTQVYNPNTQTLQAIDDSYTGNGVEAFESVDAMIQALGLLEAAAIEQATTGDDLEDHLAASLAESLDAVEESLDAVEALPKRIGWFLPAARINDIQCASVDEQIIRCKRAHHTDLDIRINGKNEAHEADWIKHMHPVSRKTDIANYFFGIDCAKSEDMPGALDLKVLKVRNPGDDIKFTFSLDTNRKISDVLTRLDADMKQREKEEETVDSEAHAELLRRVSAAIDANLARQTTELMVGQAPVEEPAPIKLPTELRGIHRGKEKRVKLNIDDDGHIVGVGHVGGIKNGELTVFAAGEAKAPYSALSKVGKLGGRYDHHAICRGNLYAPVGGYGCTCEQVDKGFKFTPPSTKTNAIYVLKDGETIMESIPDIVVTTPTKEETMKISPLEAMEILFDYMTPDKISLFDIAPKS